MATMPDYLKLTEVEQAQLDEIKVQAKQRHQRERKAAGRVGRFSYPMLPYECSWAYGELFRNTIRGRVPRLVDLQPLG